MGFVLKTKDGQYITRPISHPATDEQVETQLRKLIDDGLLSADKLLESSDWKSTVDTMVFGDEDLGAVTVSWTIGQYEDVTGGEVWDSQRMRIRTPKLHAVQPIFVRFLNTAKYKYVRYFYDKDGTYTGCDTGWQSGSSFTIPRGTYFALKVRENAYAAWTDELIATFSKTVEMTYQPVVGMQERINNVETNFESLKDLTGTVSEHTIDISAIKSSVASLPIQNSSVLVSYNQDFFSDMERGEISWESGNDISGTEDYYLRSSTYHLVDTDNGYFAVTTTDSNVIVSFYQYAKEGESYVFKSVSNWLYNAQTFKVEKECYYRVLAYNKNGISLGAFKVALTSDIVSSLIESVSGSAEVTKLLNDDLDNADVLEYNKTAQTILEITTKHPNSAVICFPTDLHLSLGSTVDEAYSVNPYLRKMLTRYNKIAELVDIDISILGGDYLCNSSQTVKDTAIASLGGLKKMLDMLTPNVPIAVVKGNHDDNTMHTDYVNGYVNDVERWNTLMKKDANKTNRDADHIQYGYGYYDIPNKKIRVFFINSVDLPTVLDEENNALSYPAQNMPGLQNAQLNFIADHLYFNEAGWQVILFAHHNPVRFINSANGGQMLLDILDAFVAKNSGTITNTKQDFESEVTFDYSNNKSNKIIAFITGHTHNDSRRVVNGIQYIDLVAAAGGLGNYAYSETRAGRYINYIVVDRESKKLTFIKDGTDPDSSANSDSTISAIGDWEVDY